MRNIKEFAADFGWPRIIIFFFLVALFVAAPFVGVRLDASISDVLNRFGQNVRGVVTDQLQSLRRFTRDDLDLGILFNGQRKIA